MVGPIFWTKRIQHYNKIGIYNNQRIIGDKNLPKGIFLHRQFLCVRDKFHVWYSAVQERLVNLMQGTAYRYLRECQVAKAVQILAHTNIVNSLFLDLKLFYTAPQVSQTGLI